MTKHTILFLAANPHGSGPGGLDLQARRVALDQEASAIRKELKLSGHGDRFDLVTRWAAEPYDLLRELRASKPTVVHFSGHGGPGGLFFQASTGDARVVSPAAIAETIAAAGGSVKLVVLSACYSEATAAALLAYVDCVVGMSGALPDDVARAFAIGFYGALGDQESVAAAHRNGNAAISLEGLSDADRPRLVVRAGADAARMVLAAVAPVAHVAQPDSYPGAGGPSGSSAPVRKVFVSHCSIDKAAVQQLVDALRARGIEGWYDAYEIGPGDDVVARINEGLAGRDVGLVIFSANTSSGCWVSAEISTLFHERVEEGKVLIPVILGDSVQIPPFLKPLARVKIDEVDRIVDAIHHGRVEPPLGAAAHPAASHTVTLALARGATGEIRITVALDGAALASCTHAALPHELIALRDEFLSGFRHATLRSPLAIERKAKEASSAALGRAMAAFCLPTPASSALDALLDSDGRIPGASIEIAIEVEVEEPDLASLPYESLRLPGSDRLLVDHSAVTMVRRPAGLGGRVPQLGQDDLIGRRLELRRVHVAAWYKRHRRVVIASGIVAFGGFILFARCMAHKQVEDCQATLNYLASRVAAGDDANTIRAGIEAVRDVCKTIRVDIAEAEAALAKHDAETKDVRKAAPVEGMSEAAPKATAAVPSRPSLPTEPLPLLAGKASEVPALEAKLAKDPAYQGVWKGPRDDLNVFLSYVSQLVATRSVPVALDTVLKAKRLRDSGVTLYMIFERINKFPNDFAVKFLAHLSSVKMHPDAGVWSESSKKNPTWHDYSCLAAWSLPEDAKMLRALLAAKAVGAGPFGWSAWGDNGPAPRPWLVDEGAALDRLALIAKLTAQEVVRAAYLKEEAKKPRQPVPMVVPLGELLGGYEDNEVRSDAAYKGKLIQTTGIVGEVKKDIMGDIYVTVETGAMFEIPTVQCFFEKDQEQTVMGLSKGNKVTVKGRVEGLMMNVLMKKCVVVP